MGKMILFQSPKISWEIFNLKAFIPLFSWPKLSQIATKIGAYINSLIPFYLKPSLTYTVSSLKSYIIKLHLVSLHLRQKVTRTKKKSKSNKQVFCDRIYEKFCILNFRLFVRTKWARENTINILMYSIN